MSECKECIKERTKRNQADTLKDNQNFLEGYCGGELKCARCGITSEHGNSFFDWHHLDPTLKEEHISKLLFLKNREKLMRELDKCICLCPSCHRIAHIEMRADE